MAALPAAASVTGSCQRYRQLPALEDRAGATQLVDIGETKLMCDMPLQVCFRELETLEGLRYRAPLFSPRR